MDFKQPKTIASLTKNSQIATKAWHEIQLKRKGIDKEQVAKELIELGLKLVKKSNNAGKLVGLGLFKVAASGHDSMDAEFQAAQLISKGIPSMLPPDRFSAMATARKLAPLGHPASTYILGLEALKEKRERQAVEYIKFAADAGLQEAQVHLGSMYQKGTANKVKDLEKAFHYVKLAHENGSRYATFMLSQMYTSGQGLPDSKPNLKLAFELTIKAASEGEKVAQHNAGQLYLGQYEKDPKSNKDSILFGIEFYKMAAEQGFIPSNVALGMIYEKGIGLVKPNSILAQFYYQSAVSLYPASDRKGDDYSYFTDAQQGLLRLSS